MTSLDPQPACAGTPLHIWFPDQQGNPADGWRDVALAKRICAGCDMRAPCLAAGMQEPHGVWGGLTPAERERVRTVGAVGAQPSDAAPETRTGRRRRVTPGLLDDVAELERQGYPLDVVAERLRVTVAAVRKARQRARRDVA